MPADFLECVAAVKAGKGGKVVRKTLKGGKYLTLCEDAEGNWHPSDVKQSKEGK